MSTPSDAVRPPAAAPAAPRGEAGWLERAWRGLRLRDAIFASLLPLGVAAMLVAGAAREYLATIQFDDWWAETASVARSFSARVDALVTLPQRLLIRQRLDQDARDAGIIRLDVPGIAWDTVVADGQANWGVWADAELRYGGTTIPVRIRKRGDNSIHWLTDKRTLTVRTPRDQFYKRYRSFGLSIKDVVPAYLVNRLAGEFELLAPDTEVVPVFLNNRFYGMYRFIEVADESFLRPFNRMPGNIFRADRAERGDYHKGVPRGVFENPYLWERVAMNDRWTSAGPGQLELLLRDLQGRTFADHQRMMARHDPDELARLFAYLLLAGDPYHMSGVHNQLLYEDPSTQLLHPIPWDIRILDLARPGSQTLNPWFQAILANPTVVDATMREAGRRLRDGGVLRTADSLARALESRYADHLRYDRLREGSIPSIGSSDAALAQLRANAGELRRWVDSSVVAVHLAWDGATGVLDLESRGFTGADLTGFAPAAGLPAGAVLRLDRNRNGVLDAADPAVAARRAAGDTLLLDQPVALLAGWDPSGPGIRPGRFAYRIFVTGAPRGAALEPVLVNRVTGVPAVRLAWEAGSAIDEGTGWHPWRFEERRGTRRVLAGEVRLAETLRVPPGDTLVIEPGTTLRLGPDVSIVSRGLVLARGTAARPIRVVPASAPRPWGTFALLGHGADRSAVEHVEFLGGGGGLVDRIEYIGMVNVHRADQVVFDHVTFRRNVRSDDTFHALHTRSLTLANSRFIEANSDAVDFDVADGLIAHNVFEGSGGDAIDLMASSPVILGNAIRNAGDKGISVGEASHPFVFDNLVEHSVRGVEVKDRSNPVLLHNEFAKNGVGLRERRKNWRYGDGGWATVVHTLFRDHGTPRERDTLSRITRYGAVGLDSLADAPTPLDLDWLYARHGIRPESPIQPGRLARWSAASPVAPIAEGQFVDDFSSIADGWAPAGGVTRLEKRRDALVMVVERVPGSATLPVGWDLAGTAGGTLVIEAAGRDLAGAELVARWEGGESRAPLATGDDLATFHFTVLRLPPRRFTSIAVHAAPRPGLSHIQRNTGLSVLTAGRLDLRSWALYPAAPAGPQPAP